jgi:purine-cytosine permease-like protein
MDLHVGPGATGVPSPGTEVQGKAFEVEHQGIDISPEQARYGRSWDLFPIWFAGNITILGIPIGAVLVSFGLTIPEALAADFIGCLSFFIVGLAAIPGARAGTATLTLSRAAFGLRGNKAPSFLSWITLVGWETISLIVGTFALEALLAKAGISSNPGIAVICLLAMAVGTFSITLLGHATIVVVQKYAMVIFGLVSLIIVVFMITHIKATVVPKPVTGSVSTTWLLALSVMFASTVFAWINYAADYTRHLPTRTSAAGIVWWTGIGAIIPGSILIGTGVLVGAQVGLASAANPIAAMSSLVPTWMAVPFLVTAIAGQLTSNFLNSYSSGLSLLALGIKVPRTRTILIDGTISVLVALYAILITNFSSTFTSFLSLEVVWIASWSAIYMVDALDRLSLRRQGYSGDDLLRIKGGQYWYRNGINWAAVGCWIVGSAGAFLFTNSALWASPLTKMWLGGADISVFVGLLLTGGLYFAVLRFMRPLPVPSTEETPAV